VAQSFYATLGVARNASDKEIRSSYRKLARRYHPDVNPNDKDAEDRFKEIQSAYDVLSDEESRKKYDKYGDRWEQAEQIEEMERHRAQAGFGGGFSFDRGFGDVDLGSMFGGIFGTGPRGARRGQDVEAPAEITLEQAASGTTRTVNLQGRETCGACRGSGGVGNARCQTCRGAGAISKPRRLEVKVPPGVRTGSRIRVAGEGQPGLGGGGSGDLYLLVTVLPHAYFERNGDDLSVDVSVPYLEAILGGEVEAPTLSGQVILTIPPLTQNGRRFRLSGKGMPVLGSQGHRGDLVARVNVMLPDELTEVERALFEELRQTKTTAQAAS